jgi:hypothetical protein
MKIPMDGGGCPIFRSYHDYKLQPKDLRLRTAYKDKKAAFNNFKDALRKDRNWRNRFTPAQAIAIDRAVATNKVYIDGFVWHHSADCKGEIMQLVNRTDHRETGHTGGWAVSRR